MLEKGTSVQTLDVAKVGQYKRRTGTIIRLVQTSNQYKRQTGTFIKKVGFWLSLKKGHCFKNKLKITPYCDKNQLNKVASFESIKQHTKKGVEFNCHKL